MRQLVTTNDKKMTNRSNKAAKFLFTDGFLCGKLIALAKPVLLGVVAASLLFSTPGFCQEAEWIWHPNWEQKSIPKIATFYRKMFKVDEVEEGQIIIAADDKYEVFINNRKVGSGSGTDTLDRYSTTKFLKKGNNLIAVRAENTDGSTAAIAARVQVKEKGKNWRSFSTDSSWKTHTSTLPIWKMQFYNDSKWRNAKSFGKLGATPPWDKAVTVAKQKPQPLNRSLANNSNKAGAPSSTEMLQSEEIPAEFAVEEVFGDDELGSVIAFEFNEFGNIIASLETGGLVMLNPNAKSKSDRVKYLTKEVNAIQGILPLNGDIYVTGVYANKLGLYRLSDKDADQQIEEISEIVSFKGYPGEHGPHGVTLGYDGSIYITIGNHVSYDGKLGKNSPFQNFYEGSIVKRYEDPGGHAKGIKAPGGTIIRTDLDGTNVEVYAGGIRNSYDIAFNNNGDLFTYDSDMETDRGLSWYRPTNLYHVVAGGEYGWRSGWAKWPSYYFDGLPAAADTGRGSPTGMVFYNHVMYPLRYKGTMFIADWSGGKIYNIAFKREGSSYKLEKELFVEGSPLNVTDLSVGPDGALYFSTGGRMTSGGIFRVRWKGSPPKSYTELKDNLSKIIRQPQPQSAYGRQNLAELQHQLGTEWDKIVLGVAMSDKNPADYRLAAINLMILYGPTADSELLIRLSQDDDEVIRAKAVRAMMLDPTESVTDRLIEMLKDESPYVQRIVCEAMSYNKIPTSYTSIQPLLDSDDRFMALAARKLLETLPPEEYRTKVLTTGNQREFIQGAHALISGNPSATNSYAILARVAEFFDEFISDKNFLDMLRLVQVAIEIGEIDAEKIPAFVDRIAEEFPSGNSLMNRELAKIVSNLQATQTIERFCDFLKSSRASNADKLDIAMHIQLIRTGWSSSQKYQLVDYLENQIRSEIEGNFSAFIRIAVREFAREFNEEEAITAIKRGKFWPNAAFSAFYKLPKKYSPELVKDLKSLDISIRGENGETYEYIKRGVIAMLAQYGGDEGTEYLKEIWRRDEARRKDVAIAFSVKPSPDTWPYLLASINEVEAEAVEVMNALAKIPQKPQEAFYYRMVIVKAQKLDNLGKFAAMNLLEFWTGKASENKYEPESGIQSWQNWFAETYPDESPATLSEESTEQKWTVSLLLEVLNDKSASKGSKVNGKKVFKSAQCSNCHRNLNFGDSVGPDLTTVSRRFTNREIIEAIVHPSDVISDQYRSELIATIDGRQLTGLTSLGPNDTVSILTEDGKKTQLENDEIEARKKSKKSVMPENLLEKLSRQEIIDLFTYMGLKDENRIAGKQRFRTR